MLDNLDEYEQASAICTTVIHANKASQIAL